MIKSAWGEMEGETGFIEDIFRDAEHSDREKDEFRLYLVQPLLAKWLQEKEFTTKCIV